MTEFLVPFFLVTSECCSVVRLRANCTERVVPAVTCFALVTKLIGCGWGVVSGDKRAEQSGR